MNDVEIKLSEDQFKLFIEFLYFADFCAWNGLISGFKSINNERRQELSIVIEKIYAAEDKPIPTGSISLNSMASRIPFSEEELESANGQISQDLDHIAHLILAREFSRRDLGLPSNYEDFYKEFPDAVELFLAKQARILEGMPPYVAEFEANGFSNLRFKMFYKPSGEQNDPG